MHLSTEPKQSAGCTVTAHQLNAFPMKLIPNQLELLANASLCAVSHRTLLGQRLHPVGCPFGVWLRHSSIPENLEARGEVQSKTCVACRVSKARLITWAWRGSNESAVTTPRTVLFFFTVILSTTVMQQMHRVANSVWERISHKKVWFKRSLINH